MRPVSPMHRMDAKWTKRKTRKRSPSRVRMCLKLKFELVTSCSGGKRLSRVVYNLIRCARGPFLVRRLFCKQSRTLPRNAAGSTRNGPAARPTRHRATAPWIASPRNACAPGQSSRGPSAGSPPTRDCAAPRVKPKAGPPTGSSLPDLASPAQAVRRIQ
jgi:hypothetical protein